MGVDNGELLQGQRYDESTDIVVPYTQQMHYDGNAIPKVGNPRTDITPNDAHSSLVRVWGAPAIDQVFLAYYTTVNLNLPDVLKSVTVTYNKSQGEGVSKREIGGVAWVGTHGGMALNPTASASGSASIIPDVQLEIAQTWGQNIPAITYLFYIPGTIVDITDIIAKLKQILTAPFSSLVSGTVTTPTAHRLTTGQGFQFVSLVNPLNGVATGVTYFARTIFSSTQFNYSAVTNGPAMSSHQATSGTFAPNVNTWPLFKPIAHTITLKGEQGSLQVSAQAELQYQWSATNDNVSIMPMDTTPTGPTYAYTESRELGNTVRSVRIPPTIHPALVFLGDLTAETEEVFVEANAFVPPITGSGGAPSFDAITSHRENTLTVNASVFPTSLPSTPGFNAIPTSGLFILDSQAEPYKYGLIRVRVTVVNFNAFA